MEFVMLYKCRCNHIINDGMKEKLKGKGQLPFIDNCFGCDSKYLPTRKLIHYFRYYFQKKKFRLV